MREAACAFEVLPVREKPRILEALGELRQEPLQAPNVKRLHGADEGRWRYRQGDYRIVYEVDRAAHKVRVLAIRQRGQVYKKR